jgi:hypothetical protein
MEKTWRWFGKKDRITLSMLRQIGVEGIVTALHEVPNGEVWSTEAINDLKNYIESYGMRWSVVESLPVCEAIKYGGPERDALIENYKISLANLGKCGVIYIEKGYGLGMAGDGMTDFSDQQLFLLGSNLPHYLENAPEYDLKEELRVNGVIIQFEKDFMQYAFSHYSQFQGINRLLEEAQRGLLFSLSNCTDNIPQIIKRIPQKEGVGQIVEFLQLLDALTHLTPQKVISSPAYDPVPARFNGRKIEKVMAFLNKHYTQPICLEDVASYAAMNPTAFCR